MKDPKMMLFITLTLVVISPLLGTAYVLASIFLFVIIVAAIAVAP